MQNRNKLLLDIRPDLALAAASGPLEQFQNQTLRPILKFQNELLILSCQQQFTRRKEVYFALPPRKQHAYITQQLTQDKNFKNLLFGMILAHLTSEEYLFFQANETTLRKRLSSLLLQRLQDQYHLITRF